MNFTEEFYGLLFGTFKAILKFEEKILNETKYKVSVSENSMIECIGKGGEKGKTISEIAGELKITSASVTIGVNKGIKKGYFVKNRSDEDERRVYVTLTTLGKRIYKAELRYHQTLVNSASKNMTDEEKKQLLNTFSKLVEFFNSKLD